MKYILVSSVILLFSCLNKKSTISNDYEGSKNCLIPLKSLLTYLDSNINNISDINCLHSKDTLIEYEEKYWHGKIYLMNKTEEPIFLFETNWEDTIKLSRLSILSTKGIKDDINFGNVGMTFLQIKNIINSNRLNEAPDGYLFLFNKLNKKISYVMDVPFDSPLTYGIKSINEIPDTLKVKSIIITNN